MAGHSRSKNGVASLARSRSKNGVASLAYGPGHPGLSTCVALKTVDAQDKPGHDGWGWTHGALAAQARRFHASAGNVFGIAATVLVDAVRR